MWQRRRISARAHHPRIVRSHLLHTHVYYATLTNLDTTWSKWEKVLIWLATYRHYYLNCTIQLVSTIQNSTFSEFWKISLINTVKKNREIFRTYIYLLDIEIVHISNEKSEHIHWEKNTLSLSCVIMKTFF